MSSGGWNKVPHPGGYNNRPLFPPCTQGRKPRSGYPWGWLLRRLHGSLRRRTPSPRGLRRRRRLCAYRAGLASLVAVTCLGLGLAGCLRETHLPSLGSCSLVGVQRGPPEPRNILNPCPTPSATQVPCPTWSAAPPNPEAHRLLQFPFKSEESRECHTLDRTEFIFAPARS